MKYVYDKRTDAALIRALGGTPATASQESVFDAGPKAFRFLAEHCLGNAMTQNSSTIGLAALDQAGVSTEE